MLVVIAKLGQFIHNVHIDDKTIQYEDEEKANHVFLPLN